MPKRKRYTKVRGACLTCKERRVRCTLERPQCQNCKRLFRACAYADQGIEQHHAATIDRSVATHCEDLELMHHYTAHTCSTLSTNPVIVQLWKEAVPRYAFRQPFLLHGLLSLAACYKIHLNQDSPNLERLVRVSNDYQQKSLSTYIYKLNDVTQDNCAALFATSQVMIAIAYARLSRHGDDNIISPAGIIDGMVVIAGLLRGAHIVARHARSWLLASDLAPMMEGLPHTWFSEQRDMQADGHEALSSLADRIIALHELTSDSKDRLQSLLSTIQYIRRLLCQDTSSVKYLHMATGLPMSFDAEYIDILKGIKDNAALAVLAYYGVALHRVRTSWWFQEIGIMLVQAVASLVDEQWYSHLAWPRAEIGE